MDVSDLIDSNLSRHSAGIAVADLDGDGRLEFIVAGQGCANRILRWSGGQLRDWAPPLLADKGYHAEAVAAGDLDGDGREELYIVNRHVGSSGEPPADRLFKVHSDGTWEDLFARPENRPLQNRSTGRSVAVVDRRGIGRYGFFLANRNRPMRLFEMGPAGSLVDLAGSLGVGFTCKARGVLTLPLFSDQTDIVCANDGGPNLLFRNRGDGTFAESALESNLGDEEEQTRALTAIDLLGDGELDLCWGNWEGPHRIMVRQDCGKWKDRAAPGLAFPSEAQTVLAADFDNDGYDELYFNNMGEPNRLFRLISKGTRASPDPLINILDPGEALDGDGFGTGAAVCDIDGDGILELLVARGERKAQPLALYKARAASANNWLRVRPLTRFSAPARGATVRMEMEGRLRVRVICGGSGYRCQMEPLAHFGLGRDGRADRVQVTWPDGASVILLNPGANRTITVPYPRG